MTYSLDKLSQRHIYIAAVLLSVLLSVISFSYLLYPAIGVDGVLYLRCAAAYDQGGLKAAMALYPWPFYPIVLAYLHQLGVSYVTAAYLLNALLQAWVVYFFIRIVFHFDSTPRVRLWALLCILCYSTLNEQRTLLIRDFGYWAFYLTSFWAALSFLKTEKQGYLWLFGLSILIAALFRVEGVVIALGSIFLFFCMPGWSFVTRCRNSLIMAWPFWLGALLFWAIGSHNLYGGGRLQEIYNIIMHGVSTVLHNETQVVHLLETSLRPHYQFIHTEQLYFGMLIGFFVYKIITSTDLIYGGFAVYAWSQKVLRLNSREKILWYGLIILQILLLFIFLMNQLFLTSRYVLALSLLIILWAPFGIEQLYQKSRLASRRRFLSINIAIICFFLFSLISNFVHVGDSKNYLYETTRWLEQHTTSNDRVAVNDAIVLYQVKGAISTWDQDLLTQAEESNCQFSAYRYVAIKFRHYKDPLAHCSNLKLVQSYHSEKDAIANIYEVRAK